MKVFWHYTKACLYVFIVNLNLGLIYITPAAAVSFTVYEQFKKAVKSEKNPGGSWNAAFISLAAGGAARILGTACRTPFDILKQQLQIENQLREEKKGIVETLKNIRTKLGFKGFFTGYKVTLLRDAPFAGIYFSSYELLKKQTRSLFDTKAFQHFSAGALAGAIATCCTISGDVVKTRLQTQSRLGSDEYAGIIDAYKKIWKNEGIRGLHKGLGPRLIYIMPASAMTFTFFEYFKKVLRINSNTTVKE